MRENGRALGHSSVLVVAFLVALNQNKELLGRRGLLPINNYLSSVRRSISAHMTTGNASNWQLVQYVPTLLWWVPEEALDEALDGVAYTGLALSIVLIVAGSGNALIFGVLWALYHSLSSVGQRW